MAPFAKSFGQAFSQSYDAESKRRRQKEDEIAQEGRLEERMGRTRAYELGQELERESRSATRQLDLERRSNELYNTRLSESDVRAIEANAREQAQAANLRATLQGENEANADKERQRIEDEARFIAAARMPSKIPVDFRAQDWKGVVADVDKTSTLRKSQAELGLPMSPYTVDLPVRYAPDEAVDPIQDAEIYKPSEADYAAVDKAQRDREEDVKNKALERQLRERNEAFFTEASSLVPLEFQNEITNDKGQITEGGAAFLRKYVKYKNVTYFDMNKGKDVTEKQLTFIRPVVEPVGKIGKDDVIVGGPGIIGEPLPGRNKDGTEIPMPLPPILETQGRPLVPMPGTAFNTPVDYLRDWNTPSNLRTQMRRVGLPEDFIPGNARDVRDMEEALDMGIRKNR